MTLALTFQTTGSFGGVSFPYGFGFDSVSGNYYVAHTSLNSSGAIINPATEDTLDTVSTNLANFETAVANAQASSLAQLQAIVTALGSVSTSAAQATAETTLQAIATSAAAGSTATGQAASLAQLEAIATTVAGAATATGQSNALSVLQGIAASLSRTVTVSDRSGSCSGTANAFTQALAANTGRGYLRISNPNASGTLYVFDKASGTPTATNSILIGPGQSFEWDIRVPSGAIQIAGSVASLAFEAAEGV